MIDDTRTSTLIRVIVAGGRDFDDYAMLCKKLDKILVNHERVKIVSGGAKGADKLGERYAREHGHALEVFPADWNKHGRSAGIIRNAEMARYASHLVAFWDKKSKGTENMIKFAQENGLFVRVVSYNLGVDSTSIRS